MRPFKASNYLTSPEGRLAQYRRRSKRRLLLGIEGIEPGSKQSMSETDKDTVQEQLLDWLDTMGRQSFRGPLALQLQLCTTIKTPVHAHHIAKNLLDLFARPRAKLKTARRALLYADDSQVHALSVACNHGSNAPSMSAAVSPLSNFLKDLDLAIHAAQERVNNSWHLEDDRSFHLAIDAFQDLLRDEANFRNRYGNHAFEAMLRGARQRAQEDLLGRPAVTPFDLAMMYNVSGRAIESELAGVWERNFALTPLRIILSELPHVDGASKLWKQEIKDKIRAFHARFGWLIDPLLVPVALEVVIKPPPPSRQRGLHDLDNVLRTYLIPQVVEILRPVSHYAFTIDREAAKRTAPEQFSTPSFADLAGRFPPPPASTKIGIIRYEAWRLPPADEASKGFVSVAVVTDITGHGGIFRQMDDEISRWRNTL